MFKYFSNINNVHVDYAVWLYNKSLTVSNQNDVLKEFAVSGHVCYLWHELARKSYGQQTTKCTYM